MENLVMEQKSFTENLLAYLRKRLKKEVKVDFHNVIKTNDVLYHSIVLVDETDERKCYPNFYIEELFQKFKAGKSVEEIGDEMIELNDMKGLPRTFTAEMLTESLGNYQLLMQKKKLFVKLLNKERNSKFLEGKAYLDYLDLAIVFYCLVGQDDDQMASVAIPKELANQWGITLEEALDPVLDVMKETLPVKRLVLPDLLKDLYYSCGLWKNKGACGCHSNNVSLEAVNDKVLQEVSKLVNDEVVTRRIIRSINRATSNEAEGIQYDIESNKRALHRTQSDIKNLQERFESSDDIEPDQYKRRMRELRQHEEIYKKRISECNHAACNIPANTYTPEQIRDILSRIKPILEKSDVVELRVLMHLMIDRIEIDPKTRSVDTIKIKFNKELTEYLCIGEEGASREASSFLLQKNIDEIMFELKVG